MHNNKFGKSNFVGKTKKLRRSSIEHPEHKVTDFKLGKRPQPSAALFSLYDEADKIICNFNSGDIFTCSDVLDELGKRPNVDQDELAANRYHLTRILIMDFMMNGLKIVGCDGAQNFYMMH